MPRWRHTAGLRGWLAIAMLAIIAIAIAVAMTVLNDAPSAQRSRRDVTRAGAARPPQPVPAVPPLELVPLAPTDAMAANAALPMVPGPLPSAAPFKFSGSADDRTAAIGCLAGALLYEAGDDPTGQQAVAQVILNRMRHPAFPSSICGVVFQGSERTTGCQFTFTCDGALNRVPSPAALARARAIAEAAIDGAVAANVGLATHYHTDWVYPYWAPTLDKVARVHTHLFYRWKGWWGTRKAFTQAYSGGEIVGARLARWVGGATAATLATVAPSDLQTRESSSVTAHAAGSGIPEAQLKGAMVAVADIERGVFVLKLNPDAFSGDYAIAALNLCSKRDSCSVVGYLPSQEPPKTLPLTPPDILRSAFYYHSNPGGSPDTTYWNCRQIPRSDRSQCLPGTR